MGDSVKDDIVRVEKQLRALVSGRINGSRDYEKAVTTLRATIEDYHLEKMGGKDFADLSGPEQGKLKLKVLTETAKLLTRVSSVKDIDREIDSYASSIKLSKDNRRDDARAVPDYKEAVKESILERDFGGRGEKYLSRDERDKLDEKLTKEFKEELKKVEKSMPGKKEYLKRYGQAGGRALVFREAAKKLRDETDSKYSRPELALNEKKKIKKNFPVLLGEALDATEKDYVTRHPEWDENGYRGLDAETALIQEIRQRLGTKTGDGKADLIKLRQTIIDITEEAAPKKKKEAKKAGMAEKPDKDFAAMLKGKEFTKIPLADVIESEKAAVPNVTEKMLSANVTLEEALTGKQAGIPLNGGPVQRTL